MRRIRNGEEERPINERERKRNEPQRQRAATVRKWGKPAYSGSRLVRPRLVRCVLVAEFQAEAHSLRPVIRTVEVERGQRGTARHATQLVGIHPQVHLVGGPHHIA